MESEKDGNTRVEKDTRVDEDRNKDTRVEDTNTDCCTQDVCTNTEISSNSHESIPESIPESIITSDTQSSPVSNVYYYDTLVLSGGSSKGIITLGAVQYVRDNYLIKNVKTYIGTSSGSMICYLLSIGYSPTEIMVYICTNQLLEKMQTFNIADMIQGKGACSFDNIHGQLEKMTISKIGYFPTLNDLHEKYGITLVCVTHNLTEKRTEYLSWETHPHLPCLTAVRMSSNLPLIFEAFKYGNNLYVDGGISDNFAIDIGHKMGKKVLGICLEYTGRDFNNYSDIRMLEYIYRLMFIPITQAIEYKISQYKDICDIKRILYNGDVKFFQFNIDVTTKMEMFSIGYDNMKKHFE